MLWLLLILMVLYFLLYLLIPKGVIWHDLLDIPLYWLRHLFTSGGKMQERRINYGPHRHQYYLLFEPPEGEERNSKIVIYFHGGIWRFGRPWNFRANAGFFVKRGYSVALPSHRRPPRYKYNDIRADLDQILLSVHEEARRMNRGNARIILAGMSSGGHLATMLLLDQAALDAIGVRREVFAGLLACGTPLNFNLLRDHLLLRDFAGPRSGELFQLANPLNYLRPEVRQPILCFHGKKDGLVPFVSIQPFINALQRYEHPLTFHPVEDGNHMSATRWVYYGGEERKVLDDWLVSLDRE